MNERPMQESLRYRGHEWQDLFSSALLGVGGELELMSHAKEARLEADAMFGSLFGGTNRMALRAISDSANMNLGPGVLLVSVGVETTQGCGIRTSDLKVCSFPDGSSGQREFDAMVGFDKIKKWDSNDPAQSKLASMIAGWAESIGANEIILHNQIGYCASAETRLLEVPIAHHKCISIDIVNRFATAIKSYYGDDTNSNSRRVWLWPKSDHFRQLQCQWTSAIPGIFFDMRGSGISGYRDGAPLLVDGSPYVHGFRSNEVIELSIKESTTYFDCDSREEINSVAQSIAKELSRIASFGTHRNESNDIDLASVYFKVVQTGLVRNCLSDFDNIGPPLQPATTNAERAPEIYAETNSRQQSLATIKLPPVESLSTLNGMETVLSPLDRAQGEERKLIRKAQRQVKKWRETYREQNSGKAPSEDDYPEEIRISMEIVKRYWKGQKASSALDKELQITTLENRNILARQVASAPAAIEVSGARPLFNGLYAAYEGRLVNGAVFFMKRPAYTEAPTTFVYKSSLNGRWNLVSHEIGMETNSCLYTSSNSAEYPSDLGLSYMMVEHDILVETKVKVSVAYPRSEREKEDGDGPGIDSKNRKRKPKEWSFRFFGYRLWIRLEDKVHPKD